MSVPIRKKSDKLLKKFVVAFFHVRECVAKNTFVKKKMDGWDKSCYEKRKRLTIGLSGGWGRPSEPMARVCGRIEGRGQTYGLFKNVEISKLKKKHLVPHPVTKLDWRCLTSVIRGMDSCPPCYGYTMLLLYSDRTSQRTSLNSIVLYTLLGIWPDAYSVHQTGLTLAYS